VKTLAKATLPDTLEELTLATWDTIEEFIATRVDPTALFANLGPVRTLRLQAGQLLLRPFELPELNSLHVRSYGLPRESVIAVVTSKLPALEHLTLWTGSSKHGSTSTVADLAPLFASGFPRLRHLALHAHEHCDEVAAGIAETPLLAKLETLDLGYGLLSDAGAEKILASAAKFAHLHELILGDNALSSAMAAKLEQALPRAKTKSHHSSSPNDDVAHFVPSHPDGGFTYLFQTG
jgi:hypothetical protein